MGLTRIQLLHRLGVLHHGPKIDDLTDKTYRDYEEKVWKGEIEDNHPWTTSFFASSFPGSEKSCGRAALYSLLNTSSVEPNSPFLRAVAEIGNAVESQIIFRWAQAGLLLGGSSPLYDGGSYKQLKFEDEETWLSGAIDAVLGIPDFSHIIPVDIKSKSDKVVEEMKIGARSYDAKHYAQVQAYCYLTTKFFDQMGWREIGYLPPVGAIIYYASRDNPRNTKEFFVDIDWDFINAGVERLKSWKASYLADELPERNKEWKWTEDPCKWCQFKREVCKPDTKAKITKLSESNSHAWTKSVKPNYNKFEGMMKVSERWS